MALAEGKSSGNKVKVEKKKEKKAKKQKTEVKLPNAKNICQICGKVSSNIGAAYTYSQYFN